MPAEMPIDASIIQSHNLVGELGVSSPLIQNRVLRDARGRTQWSVPGNSEEENLSVGVKNIQGLFLEKWPEFNNLFPRNPNGQIDPSKKEAARNFIEERIDSVPKFVEVFGRTPLSKSVSYFRSSYREVLQQAFASWGVEFEKALAKGQTEFEKDGKHWITVSGIETKYKASETGIKKYIDEVPRSYVVGMNGKVTSAYDEKALLGKAPFLLRPLVDAESRIYTDDKGGEWSTKNNIANTLGIEWKQLEKLLKTNDIKSIEGRGTNGKPAPLYNLTDVKEAIRRQPSRVILEEDALEYTDDMGKDWVALQNYHGKPGFFPLYKASTEGTLPTLWAYHKDGGKPFVMVPKGLAEQEVAPYTTRPKVDKDTGRYTKPDDSSNWITLGRLSDEYGLTIKKREQLVGVNTMLGIDSGGHSVVLYNEADALRVLRGESQELSSRDADIWLKELMNNEI